MPYHHGDLRRAILDAAVESITANGPAALSLREVSRRAGVSHAAPIHHFGDKAGVLTALAAEGYGLLADALDAAGDEFVEAGVAYVRFATTHRAHFEVMFRPDTYHRDDPAVVAARQRASQALVHGVRTRTARTGREARLTGIAAWSLVHGFATLSLTGALPDDLGDDLGEVARDVAKILVPGE
ncbi:TetR/AcrR family transcriptional regulator [Actinophytocola sp.]|uniref:TetR/AcrR family transcriptional regulator n=1 Tax=Actinophytocola sp. TaxID=1872138 RepID=UPI003899EFF7